MEGQPDERTRRVEYKGKGILKGKWKGRDIEYLEREIIIRYKGDVVKQLEDPNTRERVKNELLRDLPQGFKVVRDIDRFGIMVIEVPDSRDFLQLIEGIEGNRYVEYAEPNIIHHAFQTIPNEYVNLPQLGSFQWALNNIRAPWAWDQNVGNSKVIISIIDSGIPMPQRVTGAIYHWQNPESNDHLYTTDPFGEAAAFQGYSFKGGSFRLFPPGTLGTTPFFRWFQPNIADHFYTTDPNGEFAPAAGYVPEGNIGNIATTNIPGTVELHRWFQPNIAHHFYTTDPNGEFAPAAGYTDQGPAGFVNGTPVGTLSHPDIFQKNRIILGHNWIYGNNFPIDDLGHGTHVYGIASADTNNAFGIAGVCWNCTMHVAKVFNLFKLGTSLAFHDAVVEAVDLGKSQRKRVVINYSGGTTSPSNIAKDAVEYARDRDTLIVAAAGNNSFRSISYVAPVGWPAAWSLEYSNVIAVGAVDRANNIANFSNGGEGINVVAPGVNVLSTYPNYLTISNPASVSFQNLTGTSMATPHVSGLAALILSENPSLSPLRVRQIIEQTAVDLGPPGWDGDFGHGLINCERALAVLQPNIIFRWFQPNIADHFYTADPNGEFAPAAGYVPEGTPFRLFPPGTLGTTPFFRWFQPNIAHHFYTADPNGEFAPAAGYTDQGNIGNIATTNIPGTVELHRWFQPNIADFLYTTDPNGEFAPAAGYTDQGPAGFVRAV